MITRREAENQADRCFMYHVGCYAGTLAALFAFDRRDLPWVAGVWGIGVALHAAALYACPDTRESLVRTTAALMEDRRAALEEHQRQVQILDSGLNREFGHV